MELYHLLMGMWLGMYVKTECGAVGISVKPIWTVVGAYCVMAKAACLTASDAICFSQLQATCVGGGSECSTTRIFEIAIAMDC